MLATLLGFLRAHSRYALAALAVVALGGYFFFGRGADTGATLVIVPGEFRTQVSVSGTVIAARGANLGFAATGRISAVYADVGERVGAGAVLAEMENGDLAAALAQKRSALAETEADLASLRAGTRPEEVAVASTAVANAEADLADAMRSAYTTSDDAVRNKADAIFTNPRTNPKLSFSVSSAALKSELEQERVALEPLLASWALLVSDLSNATAAGEAPRAQGYAASVASFLADANTAVNQGLPDSTISSATLSSYASSLATARASVDTAAAALTADVNALDAAHKNLSLKQAGATADALAAQAAAVAAAAADVEQARAALAKTRVVAPFAGVVTRMDAKRGETVSPSSSLIGLQSDGIFQIEAYVPEVAIAQVAVGNQATTTLDAYGVSAEFPSVVIAVDPAETIRDGVPAYKTTLSFLEKDPRIRSGMTANAVITTGLLQNAIVIPSGSVLRSGGAAYVSLVEGDTVSRRAVALGASPALGQVEIVSGLSAGEVILLSPEP